MPFPSSTLSQSMSSLSLIQKHFNSINHIPAAMFNLLDLPIVPLEKLLKKIAPRELLILSMMNIPVPPNKTDGISLTINSREAKITVGDFCCQWVPRDVVAEALDNYQKLSKVFKGPLDVLDVHLEFVAQLDGNIPTKCRELRLHSWTGRDQQEIIDRLLAGTQMDSLFFAATRYKINHEPIFSLDRLHIHASRGEMSRKELLKCNNRMLQIDGNVCEWNINAFIKKWMKGGLNNLEVAIFSNCGEMGVALKGIKSFEFDIDNRDQFFYPSDWRMPEEIKEADCDYLELHNIQSGVNLGNAKDIRRADGTLASVREVLDGDQVQFFVWKDPRPSESIISRLEEECDELEESIERMNAYLEAAERDVSEKEAIRRDVSRLEGQICDKRQLIEDIF